MSKLIKKKSQKQESKIANDLGGKVTIASGALYFQRADVRNDKYLVECKFTEKAYYSLTIKTWEKIRSEAIKDGLRIPVMEIEVYGKDPNAFAVMDINDFEAEFEGLNGLFEPLLMNVIDNGNKSFRVTGNILTKVISTKHIPYTKVHLGKHTLAVLFWSDLILLNEKGNN